MDRRYLGAICRLDSAPIVTPCSICVFRIGRNQACEGCVMRRSRIFEAGPTNHRRYFGHSLI